MTKFETFLMYICLIFLMVVLSGLAQKRKIVNGTVQYSYRPIIFIFAMLIGWYVIAFTNIGTDYENYTWIITYSKDFIDESFVEIGFNGLAYILYSIFNNSDIVIFFIKTITIALFFYAFHIMHDQIQLWMAVLVYGLYIYLRFYLLSMTLASAVMMLSIAYLMKSKNKKSILWFAIACTIHSSCILVIPAYVIYFLFKCSAKNLSRAKVIFISFSYIAVILSSTPVYQYVISSIPALQQYNKYGISWNQGFGLLLFVRYIPLIFFAWQIYVDDENRTEANILFIFTLTAFTFDILGYKIEILSRMSSLFMAIQCIIIPSYLRRIYNTVPKRRIFDNQSIRLLWIMYIMIIGSWTFFSIINSTTSKVELYRYFNPFIQ